MKFSYQFLIVLASVLMGRLLIQTIPMIKTAFFGFLLIFFGCSPLFASQQCDGVFFQKPGNLLQYSESELTILFEKLKNNQDVDVEVAKDITDFDGFVALYMATFNRIKLQAEEPLLHRLISFLHEAVHATTHWKFRQDPFNPKNFLTIEVSRGGHAISDQLPENYKFRYGVDEYKAYLKEVKWYQQLLKMLDEMPASDPIHLYLERSSIEEAMDHSSVVAKSFVDVNLKVFSEAKWHLRQSKNLKTKLDYVVRAIPNSAPGFYEVILRIPKKSGKPLSLTFNLFEANYHLENKIEDLPDRLLEQIEFGIQKLESVRF